MRSVRCKMRSQRQGNALQLRRFHILAVVIVICGCAARVDESKLIRDASQGNARSAQLRKVFPGTRTSIRRQATRGDPFRKLYSVRWRAKLSTGFEIILTQDVDAAQDGSTKPGAAAFYIHAPSGDGDKLSDEEFDVLLAAKGDLVSLEPFGFDFSSLPVDLEKATVALRRSDPHVGLLYQISPRSAWVQINRRHRFKSEAEVLAGADIGQGYNVNLSRAIRIAADGVTPELIGQANFSLVKENEPVGAITEEQFSAVLNDRSLRILNEPPLREQIESRYRGRGIHASAAEGKIAPANR